MKHFFVLIVLLLVPIMAQAQTATSTPTSTATSTFTPTPEMIGYWACEEVASASLSDSSGTNDLAPQRTPTYRAPGSIGDYAVGGDGAGGVSGDTGGWFKTVGTPAAINYSELTIEGWVNMSAPPSSFGNIFTRIVSAGQYMWQLGVTSTRKIRLLTSRNGSATDWALSSEVLFIDDWAYIVGVIPYGGQQMRIYLNGVEVSYDTTATVGNPWNYNDNTVLAFCDQGDGNYEFNGLVNNVGLWRNPAGADWVATRYAMTKPTATDTPAQTATPELIGHWACGEAAYSPLADSAGANDLYPQKTPTYSLSQCIAGDGIGSDNDGDGNDSNENHGWFKTNGTPAAINYPNLMAEAWIYPVTPPVSFGAIMSRVETNGQMWNVGIDSNRKLRVAVSSDGVDYYFSTSTDQLTMNTCYHIVATWPNIGEQLRLYVNGSEVAAYDNTYNMPKWNWADNTALTLGMWDPVVGYGFNGAILDAKLYRNAGGADWVATQYQSYMTDTPTNTPILTATNTPTSTTTNTPTITPTNTPTDTTIDTSTVTPTNTDTYTNTPTFTPTETPTDTPTVTPTDTSTETPPVTPTDTPTATPTNTPTYTHTTISVDQENDSLAGAFNLIDNAYPAIVQEASSAARVFEYLDGAHPAWGLDSSNESSAAMLKKID